MISKMLAAALAAVLVQTPGFAAETEDKPNVRDPNEIVCTVNKQTGSRLGKSKVCRTRAAIAAERAEMRRQIDRTQSSRATNY